MDTTQAISRNKLLVNPLAACLMFALATGDLTCHAVEAATLPVTNCNDADSGSLRETLARAQSGDTVDLRSLACEHISLTSGELLITANDLVLQGPGSARLTIAAESQVHLSVILHQGKGTLRVDSLRITRGTASIYVAVLHCINSAGTLLLNESIVTGCHYGGATTSAGLIMRNSTVSDSDGGVMVGAGVASITGSTFSGNNLYPMEIGATSSGGPALIENTTISGNRLPAGYYGGIYNGAAGRLLRPVTISNSTIAFNSSASGGVGGLVVNASPVMLESTIFANNSAADLGVPDGTVIGGHNNLMMAGANVPPPADTLTAAALLEPLADNGGPTWTHALASGSPAIDAGNNLAGLASDQRGSPFVRAAGARPDIGAFESQPAATAGVSIGPGFTGSWFDPAQSGHGLMLEVLSDHRLLAMWFAFNPQGNEQSWFGGVGTYSGATATIIDVAQPTGGRWIPNFDPNSIARSPWGTLTFTFTDCNHGRVDFSSGLGYGSGSMNLLRLTQPVGLTCP